MTRRHVNLAVIIVLVIAAACTPADGDAGVVASTPPATAAPATAASPSPSPSPVETNPAALLGPQWLVDSDGNVVPDFVERELGYDPNVDADAARQLRRIAETTGGTYTTADTAAQLNRYFDRQRELITALGDQIDCVYQQFIDSKGCAGEFIEAVQARFGEERTRYPDDAPRRRALMDLFTEINKQDNDATFARADLTVEQMDALRIERRNARRRWRQRYCRDTSALDLDCTRPLLATMW